MWQKLDLNIIMAMELYQQQHWLSTSLEPLVFYKILIEITVEMSSGNKNTWRPANLPTRGNVGAMCYETWFVMVIRSKRNRLFRLNTETKLETKQARK